jgi:GntR family transcriptional regulator, transcriptional repressor for pyruvate dehydrogenase complex
MTARSARTAASSKPKPKTVTVTSTAVHDETALRDRSNGAARRTEKVSEVVAQSIVQDIVARDLPPGTMLPPESVMLERYRVGRASLREGLRILEIQGLITIKPGPGGGPVVGSATSRDFGRMSTLHYQAARAPFRALVEARRVIEPMMVGLAAEARDPKLIARLRELSQQVRSQIDDDATYKAGTADFHRIIAGSSGNQVLDLFGQSLLDIYWERVAGTLFALEHRVHVQDEHDAITKAIEAGDAKRAQRLMDSHMDDVVQGVVDRYPGLLDEVVDWR